MQVCKRITARPVVVSMSINMHKLERILTGMPTKKVWERIQKIAVLKQLPTHFEARREKGVGMPFPRVPATLHPWILL